ncbi:hypothetical protein ACFWPH_11710 [Nocardia sp. NPDC058499]|uniref:hypothetical protein n=1 Tax=Nocardia sp. NPDC058499 TaxID=3346530 RepID=UPI0036666265
MTLRRVGSKTASGHVAGLALLLKYLPWTPATSGLDARYTLERMALNNARWP